MGFDKLAAAVKDTLMGALRLLVKLTNVFVRNRSQRISTIPGRLIALHGFTTGTPVARVYTVC